jgi:hypothetical protein
MASRHKTILEEMDEGFPVIAAVPQRPQPMRSIGGLMRAILERAILDLLLNEGHAEAAADWIAGNEEDESTDWPFTFKALCGHLGLNPDRVRKAIAKMDGKKATLHREAGGICLRREQA